jgi:hypothetical protein
MIIMRNADAQKASHKSVVVTGPTSAMTAPLAVEASNGATVAAEICCQRADARVDKARYAEVAKKMTQVLFSRGVDDWSSSSPLSRGMGNTQRIQISTVAEVTTIMLRYWVNQGYVNKDTFEKSRSDGNF